MVFSSPIFLFYFLPIALLAYFAARGSSRLTVLAAFSYLFYGWLTPWFVALIVWTTLVDYTTANLIGGHWRPFGWNLQRQRKLFLCISLVDSIGMLLFFKYFSFAQENVNALLAHF